MTAANQKEMYNRKYVGEKWNLVKLRPDALSTTRYDDAARLLRSESASGSMLDIGCGSGQLTLAMTEQFEKVVGMDISEVRINSAREALRMYCPHLSEKVEFLTGDGDGKLPFDDASFDVVLLISVIGLLVNPFALMDEVARVCKAGGCLIVSTANICYFKHVISLLRGQVPLTGSPTRDIAYWREHGWDGGRMHYFSRSTLDAFLRNAGFTPEEWTGDGKWAKLRRWGTNFVGNLTVRARRMES